MMLWVSAAVVVAISLFFLLRGLSAPADASEPAAEDVVYYRAQQAELGRQLAAGMIDAAEARAGEAEAARRLLARSREDRAAPAADPGRGRIARMLIAVAAPLVGLSLYVLLGAPHLPDQPFAARTDISGAERDLTRLVGRLEQHLAESPDDVKAWELAFPFYLRMQRFDEAATAAERLLALKGESAERLTALAEARIFAAQGVVSDEARKTLARSMELDPKLPRTVFYHGLAIEQGGDPAAALAIWRELAERLPDGAEKRAVAAQIERLAPPSAPQGETADAVRAMPEGEQRQAIRAMVESLETRLKDAGGTPDEWLRLVRSLAVVGEKDRAASALSRALAQHAANGEAVAALNRLAAELSIKEGAKP